MSAKPKSDRRAEALQAEMRRTVSRLWALSVGLMRAETVFAAFQREAEVLFNGDSTDEQLIEELPAYVTRLEASPLIRAGGMMMLYLGTLYTVVEGWRKWGFVDAAVDDLLNSPFVKELKDYRHAVFHISDANDPRIMQWTAEEDRTRWSQTLAAALRRALLDLHQNLEARVTVHLLRRGL